MELLKIAQLRLDSVAMNLRRFVRPERVAEYALLYAEHGDDVLPPIEVFFDGENYWPGGGQYRLAARQFLEKDDVPVNIRNGDAFDAIRHSCGDNNHGERWSPGELEIAIKTLMLNFPDMSERDIARTVGCMQYAVPMVKEKTKSLQQAKEPDSGAMGESHETSEDPDGNDDPPNDLGPEDFGGAGCDNQFSTERDSPPVPVEAPLRDPNGMAIVEPQHIEAFNIGRSMLAISYIITKTYNGLAKIAKTPGGEHLDIERIRHHLLEAAQFVEHAIPFVLIPKHLLPKLEPQHVKRGWLTRFVWDNIPESLKKPPTGPRPTPSEIGPR